MGRSAVMVPGVRPSMSLASSPIATIRGRFDASAFASATTDGSVRTIPFPRTYTMTLAVPRSMPIWRENTRRTLTGYKSQKCARSSRTDRCEDEVGCKTEDEPGQDAPGGHVFVSQLACDSEELDDDIQDGTRREREECRKDCLVLKGLTDDRSDEGRTARDQPERAEKTPAREVRFTGERSHDAEALGRVVEREPNDQHECQAELSPGGRLADRQALREVVETDPEGDEEREPLRRLQTRDRTGAELANVRRTRAKTHRRASPSSKPEVVVNEAHQPDRQRRRKDNGEPPEVQPRTAARRRLRERFLDGFDPFRE